MNNEIERSTRNRKEFILRPGSYWGATAANRGAKRQPTNGYIASDFKMRYLTGPIHTKYSQRWASSAWLKITSGASLPAPLLRSFHRAAQQLAADNLGSFRASRVLSRFVKLHPRFSGASTASTSSTTSAVGWRTNARALHPPIPIKLSMNYLSRLEQEKNRKRQREQKREREREKAWTYRGTDIANTTSTQNRFTRMYPIPPSPLPTPRSLAPYFNPLPLLSPCSRNY